MPGAGGRTRTELSLQRILSPLSLSLTMRYYWLFFFAHVKMCNFMCKFCITASKNRATIMQCTPELQPRRHAASVLRFRRPDPRRNEPSGSATGGKAEVSRTKVIPRMPESVLFSETLEATASEVTEAVKVQGLEGVIAKRRDSF